MLSEDGTRHKLSPALVFSSTKHGRLSLLSIELATKCQSMRRAMQWLLESRSSFTEAWHLLAHDNEQQSYQCCQVRPATDGITKKSRAYSKLSIQALGVKFLGEQLGITEARVNGWKETMTQNIQAVGKRAELRWNGDGTTSRVLAEPAPQLELAFSQHLQSF